MVNMKLAITGVIIFLGFIFGSLFVVLNTTPWENEKVNSSLHSLLKKELPDWKFTDTNVQALMSSASLKKQGEKETLEVIVSGKKESHEFKVTCTDYERTRDNGVWWIPTCNQYEVKISGEKTLKSVHDLKLQNWPKKMSLWDN